MYYYTRNEYSIILLRLLILLRSSTTGTLPKASLSWTGTPNLSAGLIIITLLNMWLPISGLGGGKGGNGTLRRSLLIYSWNDARLSTRWRFHMALKYTWFSINDVATSGLRSMLNESIRCFLASSSSPIILDLCWIWVNLRETKAKWNNRVWKIKTKKKPRRTCHSGSCRCFWQASCSSSVTTYRVSN